MRVAAALLEVRDDHRNDERTQGIPDESEWIAGIEQPARSAVPRHRMHAAWSRHALWRYGDSPGPGAGSEPAGCADRGNDSHGDERCDREWHHHLRERRY